MMKQKQCSPAILQSYKQWREKRLPLTREENSISLILKKIKQYLLISPLFNYSKNYEQVQSKRIRKKTTRFSRGK